MLRSGRSACCCNPCRRRGHSRSSPVCARASRDGGTHESCTEVMMKRYAVGLGRAAIRPVALCHITNLELRFGGSASRGITPIGQSEPQRIRNDSSIHLTDRPCKALIVGVFGCACSNAARCQPCRTKHGSLRASTFTTTPSAEWCGYVSSKACVCTRLHAGRAVAG